jgi:mono/diheme cytochrome c family protein
MGSTFEREGEMIMRLSSAAPVALALLLGLGQAACNPKAPANEQVGAARVDTAPPTADTITPPADTSRRLDTMAGPKPDTSVASPPINPPSTETPRDTPPSAAAKPGAKPAAGGGAKVSKLEYEGWRQYSVHCARCHGQDVLPNPVAANLLVSLGPGGPISSEETFAQVVTAGRPASGMPAFKGTLSPDDIKAIYAYVKGRAEKRIPPGRPEQPA